MLQSFNLITEIMKQWFVMKTEHRYFKYLDLVIRRRISGRVGHTSSSYKYFQVFIHKHYLVFTHLTLLLRICLLYCYIFSLSV